MLNVMPGEAMPINSWNFICLLNIYRSIPHASSFLEMYNDYFGFECKKKKEA